MKAQSASADSVEVKRLFVMFLFIGFSVVWFSFYICQALFFSHKQARHFGRTGYAWRDYSRFFENLSITQTGYMAGEAEKECWWGVGVVE
jgi:hypothetical protein